MCLKACLRCNADPRRLAQALGNLLANALKFTPESGRVRFSARQQGDGSLHMLVEDTGIGMAPETVTLALEPFRQIDGSLARRLKAPAWACPSPRLWRNCMAAA